MARLTGDASVLDFIGAEVISVAVGARAAGNGVDRLGRAILDIVADASLSDASIVGNAVLVGRPRSVEAIRAFPHELRVRGNVASAWVSTLS